MYKIVPSTAMLLALMALPLQAAANSTVGNPAPTTYDAPTTEDAPVAPSAHPEPEGLYGRDRGVSDLMRSPSYNPTDRTGSTGYYNPSRDVRNNTTSSPTTDRPGGTTGK